MKIIPTLQGLQSVFEQRSSEYEEIERKRNLAKAALESARIAYEKNDGDLSRAWNARYEAQHAVYAERLKLKLKTPPHGLPWLSESKQAYDEIVVTNLAAIEEYFRVCGKDDDRWEIVAEALLKAAGDTHIVKNDKPRNHSFELAQAYTRFCNRTNRVAA